jgi:hypothetical protein
VKYLEAAIEGLPDHVAAHIREIFSAYLRRAECEATAAVWLARTLNHYGVIYVN